MRAKNWWQVTVMQMLKAYPELRERKDEIQAQSVTANYSGEPRGGGNSRAVENAALISLAPAEERVLEAIESALEELDTMNAIYRKYITLRYWKGYTHTDAAYRISVASSTADRINRICIRTVAKNIRLI